MALMTAEELEAGLQDFYGTESWHRLTLGDIVYTDGVRFLAENAGCYWLLDLIASYQPELRSQDGTRDFQVWTLERSGQTAIVRCLADTDDIRVTQMIGYTDFPLKEIKLYVQSGCIDGATPQWVGMLPSEY